MNYIKGKFRNIIYQNKENGYTVAIFRIKETNDIALQNYLNKTVTITGVFLDINDNLNYILKGEYIKHERFGYQYKVESYEKEELKTEDSLIEYLSSPLIKGCGKTTAEKIVKALGIDAIKLIKEDYQVLLNIGGLNEAKAKTIQASLLENSDSDDTLIKLKDLGFSISEATKIYKKYQEKTKYIIECDLYALNEIIDFNKLDNIFLKNHDSNDDIRLKACIIEAMKRLSFTNGDTYYYEEEITSLLKTDFTIIIDDIKLAEIFYTLEEENKIVIQDNLYYLTEYYEAESNIVSKKCHKKSFRK